VYHSLRNPAADHLHTYTSKSDANAACLPNLQFHNLLTLIKIAIREPLSESFIRLLLTLLYMSTDLNSPSQQYEIGVFHYINHR